MDLMDLMDLLNLMDLGSGIKVAFPRFDQGTSGL